MDVDKLPVHRFLEGSRKSFIIPVYQRDYAWTKINCEKIWEDLIDLKENKRSDHFLGTVVTIGEGYEEYTVIDGQQRLTTISILLIALHNYLNNKELEVEEEKRLSKEILKFLIDEDSPEDKRIRLKPNKQDKEYFESLFDKGSIKDPNSNIESNYRFFYDNIKTGVLSPKEISESFRKLKIVLIHLDRQQDDPQLIFESLNSTGVGLTAGDLIRNHILMDLKPDEQEKLYKNYWVVIESLTGDSSEFVRNYLIFKTKLWVKKDDVYNGFKKHSLKLNANKEEILKDLLIFAEIYSWLVQINKHENKELNQRLERLNKLEFTVSHPYLIDVFNDLRNNILSEGIVKEILMIIESYAFRKILVDNTKQGLNKMFITLSKEIKKDGEWKEKYLDILNFILLEKKGSLKFPNDEEFENALITKEVYNLQAKNRNFLLESLENYKSAYPPVNVDEYKLTIEHIMPQKLTEKWKNKLGEKSEETHKKYLHTIGNLSLTAKNQELSNKSFEDKQQIDFQTSKLKLNFRLDELKEWNREKIIERAKGLSKNAKDIWPYPRTEYSKPIAEEQKFDLTSKDGFSGSKPSRLYIEEDEEGIKLSTWRDLLREGCKILYEFSPTEFSEIQKSQEFRRRYFGEEKSLRRPIEFIQGKFVEGNLSANNIIAFLSKVCERINYPAEKISFSIKYAKE